MIDREFDNPDLARRMISEITALSSSCGNLVIMEVCGTHTMEIGRLGIRSLLPGSLRLVSGPGCPVCVTPEEVIDAAVYCARQTDCTVLSFGDMLRVPGRNGSLDTARSYGGSVEVVTSALDALRMAKENPKRKYVFVAVGFETTIPGIARTVELTADMNMSNLYYLLSVRTVPNVLEVLCSDSDLKISGFILPGHVSAITGFEAYRALYTHAIPGVITGFSPLDILGGLHRLLTMISKGMSGVENMYPRFVRHEGNPSARHCMEKIFDPVDAVWRGIGVIPSSGLTFKEKYRRFDVREKLAIPKEDTSMPKGCSCGEVLKGKLPPDQCPLFGTTCIPDNPVGPCMVSSEGSCAAYYKYERNG